MQITSGHGLDALGTTPATRLGSGGTTLIAPASAAVQVATTRSSTLLYARRAFLSIPLGSLGNGGGQRQSLRGVGWNHMSRLLPARPHDSLRRLTLRHHHRTMSTSWVALAVATVPGHYSPLYYNTAISAVDTPRLIRDTPRPIRAILIAANLRVIVTYVLPTTRSYGLMRSLAFLAYLPWLAQATHRDNHT